jgi:diguanylate cyclase (GGDEF)-like protein
LGADDYITKPFDIEELKLRVQGAIRRSERESLTDPRSGLPAGRLIEEQLRRIIRATDWALIDLRVNNFEAFKDVYGFVAGDDVLRFASMMIGEVVDELGTTSDFIGHAGGDNFIIITTNEAATAIRQKLKDRFAAEVQSHYNFIDRQQGFIQAPKPEGGVEKVGFMTLSAGTVSPSSHSFADIREITELAAEARRQDSAAASTA